MASRVTLEMSDINELISARAAIINAKNSLESYRQYMQPAYHPDFIYPPAAHHKLIQSALEDLVLTDDYDAILIMAPPGSAKSTYASVQFATWYFANNPAHKILACSNTTALAEDFARRRRAVCELEEWERLSGVSLDPSQMGQAAFATTTAGVMYARGVGSSIAGLRCNLLLIDDAIASFEEAQSPMQLDKIWDWYEFDARTRLIPSGKEAMIMTRWSRKDPAGRILQKIADGTENKRWRILRLPMLCDDPENDPMGRAMDEPLWPDWFSQAQINDNINHPIRWPSLYQQVPVDAGGSWVADEFIQFIDFKNLPENLTYTIALDLALSNAKGDYTVITVGAMDEKRNLYIVDCVRFQKEVSYTLRKLTGMVDHYHPRYTLIDDDPAAKVFVESMKEYARTTGFAINMRALPIRGNDKEFRAAPIRDIFMQGRVYIVQSGWTGAMIGEIMNFPPKSRTEHEDIIDTLALLGRDMGMQTAPTPTIDPKLEEIRGAFTQTADGAVTTQTLDEMWTDHPLSLTGRPRRI